MIDNQFPLISSIKKQELKRTITFVLKTNSQGEAKDIKSKISFKLPEINQRIIKNLETIARLSSATPVRINITHSSPAFPEFNEKIEDIFDVIGDGEKLRILIKFENYDTDGLKKIISEKQISHLVEIGYGKTTPNSHDLNAIELSCATIYPKSTEGVYRIIEDVVMDIAMFHTFVSPCFPDIPVDIKRAFSQLKVTYAEKLRLTSDSWNTKDNKSYISLAGYYRNKNSFDFGGYIKCWSDILSEAQGLYSNYYINKNIPIDEQLKRHKLYKQLPIKKIQKLFAGSAPGKYILICTTRRPVQIKKRKEIMVYFIGERWRKGRVNILPFEKIEEIARYSQWISIFQITKQ